MKRFLAVITAAALLSAAPAAYGAPTRKPPKPTPTPTVTATPTPTPTPTPTSPSPTATSTGTCGGPITVSAAATLTGCYRSTNPSVPAIKINTTAAVVLDHARVEHAGDGINDHYVNNARITIKNSTFQQLDPGAATWKRAVDLWAPASFTAEYNRFTDGDGIYLAGGTTGSITVRYNVATNIGRYPRTTSGGCCVQFLQLNGMNSPNIEIAWNKVTNTPGQSDVEDNINLYNSGGTAASPSQVHHNLIDGAYPRSLNYSGFTGGGINVGDAGDHDNRAHDNVVVSTTNYGTGISQANNESHNNLLINDGVEQRSDFGQAVVAFENVTPPGLHTSGNRYNWKRFAGDSNQWQCYMPEFCSNGTQVSLTEDQARAEWEAGRVAAGVTVGPVS